MAGRSAGHRVLVVDDVDEMRVVIRRALRACGYQVDVAATLAEASRLDPGGYDAVLVDAHLGHERGIDLIDDMRSEDPAAVSRCLVMTGGTTSSLPDGVRCLLKPFQISELIAAVGALHQPDAVPAPGPAAPAGDSGVQSATPALPDKSPAAGESQVWQLLSIARRVRARERGELVDFLHDGPIQELTAATLELQLMARSEPPEAAPRFEQVLRQLDAAAGSLRWLVDGHFALPETRLTTALQQRTAWLLADPVTVAAGDQPGLGAIEVLGIVDVVELMLLGVVPDGQALHAHVAVRTQEQLIEIELTLTTAAGTGQPIGDQSAARAALNGLACALATSAQAEFCKRHWRATIVLPRQPAATLPARDMTPSSVTGT